MERAIIEYKIIVGEFSRDITAEVEKILSEGWQPYQGLVVKSGLFYQIVVRYERHA